MRIELTKNVKFIINTLEDNGYDAFIVGGSVRDQLMKKKVSDYDITTNARPEIVKKLFKKTIDTGIEHGTVTVVINDKNKNQNFEVTTFRIDGEYKDGRHPMSVRFVNELYYDLSRRDFTINAIAYNERYGLVDRFGGSKDIKKKIIKAVGNPIDRFNEDALRMIRAIRFAAKFDFTIEEETKNAIIKLSSNIKKVSKERIHIELDKIITSEHPEFIKCIVEYGLAQFIAKDFEYINLNKIIKTDKLYIAYISLFYNTKIIPKKILKELKYDTELIKHVDIVLSKIDEFKNIVEKQNNDSKLKFLISEIGYDYCYDLIKIVSFKENKNLKHILEKVINYETNKDPIFLKDMKINGYDLMSIGIKNKNIGLVLNKLLIKIHSDKTINNRDELIKIAKGVKNELY